MCICKYLTVLSLAGTTDLSFVDPVIIGRNAFSVTNDVVSGVAGHVQDGLCAVLDVLLDTLKGNNLLRFLTLWVLI